MGRKTPRGSYVCGDCHYRRQTLAPPQGWAKYLNVWLCDVCKPFWPVKHIPVQWLHVS